MNLDFAMARDNLFSCIHSIILSNSKLIFLVTSASYLKDPLGWDIFNVVNFDNLIYMKLYSLLIVTKIRKSQKKNLKHRKRAK